MLPILTSARCLKQHAMALPERREQRRLSSDAADGGHEESEWLHARTDRMVGGSHRVLRHLGSGGMGHVFLAEHIGLGTQAAMKVARPESRGATDILLREARLLSRLHHPNIPSALDWGHMEDGTPYLLMGYAHGLELDAWLESCGAPEIPRVIKILEQIASAVDYLHQQGIVHSDIKPANVMFEPRARDFTTLIDFGIAFQMSEPRGDRTVYGTPGYMAPEAWLGVECGAGVDRYGVAALALELLTGSLPYDPQAVCRLSSTERFRQPTLPSSCGLYAPTLDAVFARGLHVDPRRRFTRVADFVEALAEAIRAVHRGDTTRPFAGSSAQSNACSSEPPARARTVRSFRRWARAKCARLAMHPD